MQAQPSAPVRDFLQNISGYLPQLAAALLVVAIGLAVGWVVKRAAVRILIWLRLDRLARRTGWRATFGKGDVRAALYNLLGSIAMLIVFLVFLDNALQILGLTVLSRLIDAVVFYLPNLALATLVVGVGVPLAGLAASRAEHAMEDEDFAHASLLAKMLKGVLLSVVTALTLWQLNFARQIVLAGFLISFGAIGVAFAIAIGLGSARGVQRGWEALFEKKKDG